MIHAFLPPADAYAIYGIVPSDLRLVVRRYRATARWSSESAQIDVVGPESALWTVLRWLRRPVQLLNEAGAVVWNGFVFEAEVSSGALRVATSLGDMANRITAAYTQPTPTGYERRTTPAVDDTDSQYRYGIKEKMLSIGEATDEQAQAQAQAALAALAQPPLLPTFGGGGGGGLAATLYCVGWSEMLRWRRYARSGARVALDGAAGIAQPIGWQLVSADVMFSRKTGITDFGGRLASLPPGVTVAVSGSTSNNRNFVITQAQNNAAHSYTANTIFFDASDDIYDNAQGFDFIEVWSTIRISGSAQNNGVYEVDGKTNAGYFTVTGGSIVSAGAGPTITIEQAASTAVSPAPTTEYSANTKTLTVHGYRLAQSFVAPKSLPLDAISIMAAVVGAPPDALRVALYSDSGGQPGTLIASSTLAAANLQSGAPAWTKFSFSPRVTLTASQTYWIVVERSGALDSLNHYAVTTTPVAGGACLAWTGSAWIVNPSGEYLPHIVQLVEETTTQIAQIAAASGFVAATRIEIASGIFTSPDRDGDTSAFDEIDKLLATPTAAGDRLQAAIDSNRTLRIYAAPQPPAPGAALLYALDGRLISGGGQIVVDGVLPAGQWLEIDRAPRNLNISPVFVDAAEYDATNGTYSIMPRGAIDGLRA